jgi:CubicO group peptidase (beta-lactamase class C family)
MKSQKAKYFLFIRVFFMLTSQQGYAQSPDSATVEVLKNIRAVENNLAGINGTGKDSAWNIQSRMDYYKIKGVSVAVIHNYKIEWTKGYGWADEDARIPVSPETRFQAASISKSLNAVGVLNLAQENKLNLQADINQYLTSWKFPYDINSKGKKISTIELLSHTAGLNVHGFEGYQMGATLPTIVQILNGQPPANSAAIRSMIEPQLRSEYSGGGITISQLIVMDITRIPYALFMKEEVLTPLGMTGSSYEQPMNIDSTLLATGYRANGDEVPGKYHVYPEQAAAGLWTNPTDLSKYIIETQLAYEGNSAKVLNQTMTRLRLTPNGDVHAALGVFIDNPGGAVYFQHGGANEGFRCQYMGSLSGGDGLVIMVNSDNGDIIPEIVNSIARVYHWKGLTIYHLNQKKPGFFYLWISAALLLILSAIFLITKRNKRKRQSAMTFYS